MEQSEQISNVGKMCAVFSIATMAIPAFDGGPASFVFPAFGLSYYLVGTLEADISSHPDSKNRKSDQGGAFRIERQYTPSTF
jgi:hypothetical protein